MQITFHLWDKQLGVFRLAWLRCECAAWLPLLFTVRGCNFHQQINGEKQVRFPRVAKSWKATQDSKGVVPELQPHQSVYRLNDLRYV